jgi:hypothetical protein
MAHHDTSDNRNPEANPQSSDNNGLNLVDIIIGIVVGFGGLVAAIIGCLISWLNYKAAAKRAGETETARGFGRYMRHGFSIKRGASTNDLVQSWLKTVPPITHDRPVLSYPSTYSTSANGRDKSSRRIRDGGDGDEGDGDGGDGDGGDGDGRI